jgi:hypothetical protein
MLMKKYLSLYCNQERDMNREQIIDTFRSLAMSQGFYGRLLRGINEMDEDDREEYLSYLESLNFADELDLILYIEG